jgi:hypothetical protein
MSNYDKKMLAEAVTLFTLAAVGLVLLGVLAGWATTWSIVAGVVLGMLVLVGVTTGLDWLTDRIWPPDEER